MQHLTHRWRKNLVEPAAVVWFALHTGEGGLITLEVGEHAWVGCNARTHTHTSRSIWTNMSPVQPLSWKHIRLPNVPQAYHATENKLELVLGISELILLPLAQISDCIYRGNHHTCNSEWQRGVTRVALGWIKHKLCTRSAGHVL